MAKPFDAKAKAKRQKIIAGVLGLVLVSVLVFQAPTILGMFSGSSSSTATEPAATPPPAPAPAAPGAPAPATPGAPATPAAGGGSATLVDTDPVPTPTPGQLVTFDRFESKDPFVQQVSDAPPSSTSGEETPAPGEDNEAPAGDEKQPGLDGPHEILGGTGSTGGEETAPTGAKIAVNGTEYTVAVGGEFPENDPMFKLVSLKKGVAKIGIAGGSYANGSQTISLKKGGKPVTLMNTADGTQYVLRYVG
ncbi:MAG TPA: hypothetical protein VH968_04940 [Gaiellaceae bacterium]|jgi:hypothetical protein